MIVELDFQMEVKISLEHGTIIDPEKFVAERIPFAGSELELGGYSGLTEIDLVNMDEESDLESVYMVGDKLTLDEIRSYLQPYARGIDCHVGFFFANAVHDVFPPTKENLKKVLNVALSNGNYDKVKEIAEKLMQIK